MGTLSDGCGCDYGVALALADELHLCLLQQLYFRKKLCWKENYFGSQTSEHEHSEQCTTLSDCQAKELWSNYIS